MLIVVDFWRIKLILEKNIFVVKISDGFNGVCGGIFVGGIKVG